MQNPNESPAPHAEGTTPGAAAPESDPDASSDDEQIRLLLMGFATGLTIGGVFLIYIVLETAKLL